MVTAFITHPVFKKHDMGMGHPECPARLSAVEDLLIASGMLDALKQLEPGEAKREDLERVHTASYVDSVFESAPSDAGMAWLDPDTCMNTYTLEAALRAAGAQILAVDSVMNGTVTNAYCHVRPPGHHAEHDRAMGFCFFNNVAVGAAYALAEKGVNRVAIVDFDVHHGNGTEDIFSGRDNVLFCSTFQHPHYPYSGAHTQADNIVNVPLAAGADERVFRKAVTEHWMPALNNFRPEMVFISAGFDAHIEDPLAGLAFGDDDYFWVTEQVMDIAERHAGGRIVSTLEGGYALDALARSVKAHLTALSGV